MGRLVKIQSISDLITNSSSEVYLCKVTENFRKTFNENDLEYFSAVFLTEEDIKNYLLKTDRWKIEADFDDVLTSNPLGDCNLWDWCEGDAERTKEEIVDFFLPAYKCLLGYALFSREDDYKWDTFDNYLQNRDENEDRVVYAHS